MECWKGSFGLHYEGIRIGNLNFVPENNNKLPMYFPSWAIIFTGKNNCEVKYTNYKWTVLISMYLCPCNHYPDQDAEHDQLPNSLSPLLDTPSKGDYYSDFCYLRLMLPVLEHHTNGLIQHVLFCVWLFPQWYVFEIHCDFVCSYDSFHFIDECYSNMWILHNSLIIPLLMDIWVE